MKNYRRALVYGLAVVLGLFVLTAATLLLLSPFEHRLACQFQTALYDFTGIQSLYEWPPEADEHFTGTARIWNEWGVLRLERPYHDGQRHGVWKEYDENGELTLISEYKHGLPWNGICYIWNEKGWVAEYKNGQPYNGCVETPDPNSEGFAGETCYIDGREVSDEEFMAYHEIKVSSDELLFGIDVFAESQRTSLTEPR